MKRGWAWLAVLDKQGLQEALAYDLAGCNPLYSHVDATAGTDDIARNVCAAGSAGVRPENRRTNNSTA